MLKRTLFFSNPCNLSLKNKQLVVKMKNEVKSTIPIEDVGFVLIENQQVLVNIPLLEELVTQNVAVIFCNNKHMPHSLLFPLDGNNLQSMVFRQQIKASDVLKKQIWKQVIEAKIRNQALLLKRKNIKWEDILNLSKHVKSNDVDGREGVAAKIYWQRLFGKSFYRDRYGPFPNNLLNYGYIILRAAVARALTGSGLLPTFGIHHHNKYNSFCLADDIMEPYRPFVDSIVIDIFEKYPEMLNLDKEIKAELLKVLVTDVKFSKVTRPLMIGLSQTTASLVKCFTGEIRNIYFPVMS